MTGKIVSLADRRGGEDPPADRIIWRCECGCQSFLLRADNEAECCHCEGLASMPGGGGWRKALPETPEQPRDMEDMSRIVVNMDETGSALTRIIGHAQAETTAVLVVIQNNGSVHTWQGGGFEGAEVDWLDERIAIGRSTILGETK